LMLAGLGALALISPAWLVLVHLTTSVPNGMRMWLPTYLIWFLAGMSLTVLQAMGVRCYAFVALPLAVICYFIASTPIAGDPTTSPLGLSQALYKAVFYAAIAALAVAPLALGNQGLYARFLASRPMVWLGEISYEIFLVHLVTMEIAMVDVVRYHVYTGSMLNLFVATLVLTIPVAWLLHRLTRVRS
jgi:peptidoglycan/LPS O-acetylase OafA/YrhL